MLPQIPTVEKAFAVATVAFAAVTGASWEAANVVAIFSSCAVIASAAAAIVTRLFPAKGGKRGPRKGKTKTNQQPDIPGVTRPF